MMLITSLCFQGIHDTERTNVVGFILSCLPRSPLNILQICCIEREALCLYMCKDGQMSVSGSVVPNSSFLNFVILPPDSSNYTEFLALFSLQRMHHALSTSQGTHSSLRVIFVIFFTFAYWTSFCIAREALLEVVSSVSFDSLILKKTKTQNTQTLCSCSSSVLCSLWELRNDTRPIPALAWRMTQHHFKFFSISGFISKTTFSDPTYKRRKMTRFLLSELSSNRFNSTLGCNVKNMHTHICMHNICPYTYSVFATVLKNCSFTAPATSGCNLCRFPRRFSLLFIPGENDSTLHTVADYRSFLADPAICLFCFSGYTRSQG